MDAEPSERRRQQAELYGDPIDVLARKAHQLMGLDLPALADVVGLSVPMLARLVAGERVRIGNTVAIGRIVQLQEFADNLITGRSSPDEIPLTLAQIRASTTPPRPSRVTAVPDGSVRRHPAPVPALGERPSLTPQALAYARRVVGRHVPPTPTYRWPLLEQFTRAETWVKHEDHTPTGAFTVRGGVNFLERLRVSGMPAPAGLVTAPIGNHGRSLAFAGARASMPVTLVAPDGSDPGQVDSVECWGAEVVVRGPDLWAARAHAAQLADERGLLDVPPFHPWLVEGIATHVAELHEAVPGLDTVYVPLGTGSATCAHILVRDLFGLCTEIVGVVAAAATGLARPSPDPMAVEVINRGAARIIRVGEDEIAEAAALVDRTTHTLAEPAAALALAGAHADHTGATGRKVALVLTRGPRTLTP